MNPLFHALFQKTRLLTKELNTVLKEHDLFTSQWSVLYYVHKHGEISLTDIWRNLHVEAPTITRTVSRLEVLGWLTTKPGKDRREKIVRLTEDAQAKFPSVQASVIQFENDFLTRLIESEQETLLTLLTKLEKDEGIEFE